MTVSVLYQCILREAFKINNMEADDIFHLTGFFSVKKTYVKIFANIDNVVIKDALRCVQCCFFYHQKQ